MSSSVTSYSTLGAVEIRSRLYSRSSRSRVISRCSRPEEAHPEAEAEGCGGLRFVDQRGVVEHEFLQRIPEHRIVRAVHRVEAGEHHRLGVLVAAQRLGGRLGQRGDGVPHLGLADVLHAGDQVAHLAHAQALGRRRLRGADTDFQQFVGGSGGHHLDPLARAQMAVHHADVSDHAAVGVVDRVEDHGPRRSIRISHRGRQVADNLVQQRLDAHAGLTGNQQHVLGLAADQAGQFRGVLLRLRRRQVDLVQHRDDGEVVLHGQVQVGQCLGLDALRRVHQQDRALAGRQRTGHLVGEVHVAGRVDHVQAVGGAVDFPGHAHGLGLDGDAAFALDVHPVQVLGLHVPLLDDTGQLQHPVRQGGFPMVDVGDDAEVPDDRRIGRGGHRGGAGHG